MMNVVFALLLSLAGATECGDHVATHVRDKMRTVYWSGRFDVAAFNRFVTAVVDDLPDVRLKVRRDIQQREEVVFAADKLVAKADHLLRYELRGPWPKVVLWAGVEGQTAEIGVDVSPPAFAMIRDPLRRLIEETSTVEDVGSWLATLLPAGK